MVETMSSHPADTRQLIEIRPLDSKRIERDEEYEDAVRRQIAACAATDVTPLVPARKSCNHRAF